MRWPNMRQPAAFSNTFYTEADDQLEKVLTLTEGIDAGFIAKTAVFSRGIGLHEGHAGAAHGGAFR